MIDRTDISRLLALHSRAYDWLIFLVNEAKKDPDLLSPEVLEKIGKKKSCEQWVADKWTSIPEKMRPQKSDISGFARLFSSFFDTSFRVDSLTFDGKLMDVSVKIGAKKQPLPYGVKSVKALALKHLCSAENIKLSDAESRTIANRKSIADSLTIWAYIWELDRRVRGKGKGAVVHTLWRSMPFETRKQLDVETVWKAREHLLAHVGSSSHSV